MMQGYEYMVVGCRQLFKRKKKQYSKLGSGGLVVKSCLTLCNPVDRRLPGLEKTATFQEIGIKLACSSSFMNY